MSSARALSLVALGALCAAAPAGAAPFTYAGTLEKDGTLVTDTVDLRFVIQDGGAAPDACVTAAASPSPGNPDPDSCGVWGTELPAVAVSAGRFSARLDPSFDALALLDPQLVVAVNDDGTWRLLGGAQPLDSAPRASSADIGGTLMTEFTLVPPGGAGSAYAPYEVEKLLGAGGLYNDTDTLLLTPLSTSLCFLTGVDIRFNGAQNGSDYGNIVVDHRSICRVDANTTEQRWELSAYSGRSYNDRPTNTLCKARCISWRP